MTGLMACTKDWVHTHLMTILGNLGCASKCQHSIHGIIHSTLVLPYIHVIIHYVNTVVTQSMHYSYHVHVHVYIEGEMYQLHVHVHVHVYRRNVPAACTCIQEKCTSCMYMYIHLYRRKCTNWMYMNVRCCRNAIVLKQMNLCFFQNNDSELKFTDTMSCIHNFHCYLRWRGLQWLLALLQTCLSLQRARPCPLAGHRQTWLS